MDFSCSLGPFRRVYRDGPDWTIFAPTPLRLPPLAGVRSTCCSPTCFTHSVASCSQSSDSSVRRAKLHRVKWHNSERDIRSFVRFSLARASLREIASYFAESPIKEMSHRHRADIPRIKSRRKFFVRDLA